MMNLRSPITVTVGVLVVLVGLLFGGMLALLTRPSNQPTQRTVVASTTTNSSPRAMHSRPPTPSPRAAAPTARPTVPATPTATAAPATPVAIATPAASAPSVAVVAPRAGIWRIQEANVQVGTIVWAGQGAASSGGTAIALDVRKESVAGHGVSRCERQTTLHAVVTAGASPQTVPYQEVNCSGATSNGEMRVSSFSGDGRSFSGSFWSGGSKLGDFTAETP
jgi:hypothetical protein